MSWHNDYGYDPLAGGYRPATVHESLQDRIVRMFAEVWLTDARLAEVVAEWGVES